MEKIRILFVFLGVVSFCNAWSLNPIKKDIGMSDPHVRVFGDTIFLFTGHDETPQDKIWDMRYWNIFSTVDLVNWEHRGTISPKDNYMPDDTQDCWAGDAAEQNGKYYFYFSDQKRGIGVMESDAPTGKYIDALGKPLVSPMHDPTILIDNDASKTPYIVYGDKEFGGFHVAKLNDDMISVAETPKPITINGKEWENAPIWQDKNYIFKYNGKYYLSWGSDYAVAENIYGPYTCVGSVGCGYELGKYAHGSFFWWKGQFYHVWCYYLINGLKYRETVISYCHFKENGEMVTDTRFLDQHFTNGVGQYMANWEKIEAEWYYEASEGVVKKDLDASNFAVNLTASESWLRFAKVKFIGSPLNITAAVKSSATGVVEVHKGSKDGALLAVFEFGDTKDEYKTFSTKIAEISGTEDIYLVNRSNSENGVAIDWISFHSSENE